MTGVGAVTAGQRIRAERVRARRRTEAAAQSERTREDAPEKPPRTVFERTPDPTLDTLAPDLQLQAQIAAEHRRGLRAGPMVHGAARSTYLGTEYAGPADRRARVGRMFRASI